MFNSTNIVIAAFCLLALYSGQHEAHCSDAAFDAGWKDVRGSAIRHKSFEGSLEPKILTMGRNARDTKTSVLIEASKSTRPSILRLVCKDWRDVIDAETPDNLELRYSTIGPVWKKCIQAWYGVLGHDAIWEAILNGKLWYTPVPNSQVGMVPLEISELPNPFADSFDTSFCSEADKCLDISLGLLKGKKHEDHNEVEICYIPRALGERGRDGDAAIINQIMSQLHPNHNAALIFKWGNWRNGSYKYCCWADWSALSQIKLHVQYHGDRVKFCFRDVVGSGRWTFIGSFCSLEDDLTRTMTSEV